MTKLKAYQTVKLATTLNKNHPLVKNRFYIVSGVDGNEVWVTTEIPYLEAQVPEHTLSEVHVNYLNLLETFPGTVTTKDTGFCVKEEGSPNHIDWEHNIANKVIEAHGYKLLTSFWSTGADNIRRINTEKDGVITQFQYGG